MLLVLGCLDVFNQKWNSGSGSGCSAKGTTPVLVAMKFLVSFYLSHDVKEKLWMDRMGMQNRGLNLPALIQCGPVFITLMGPYPWELCQLNFPPPRSDSTHYLVNTGRLFSVLFV